MTEVDVCGPGRRFGVTHLCQGKSIMLTPSDRQDLDIRDAQGRLGGSGCEEFTRFVRNGVSITLYRNGSMLFYHFIDEDAARTMASEVFTDLGIPEATT